MKKNLIKILAIATVAVALGACNKKGTSSSTSDSSSVVPVVKTVTIDDVLTLTTEGKWELEGKQVKVENLALAGRTGNTLYGIIAIGDYVTDLRGIQIDCKTLPTFKGSGYGSDITVVGTVQDMNGRAVLKDAEVTVNSERNDDGSQSEGHGLPIYYCPASANSRSFFNQQLGRNMSGFVVEGVYQLASLPGTLEEGKATSFYVAFPGENLDVEDEDNYSLIKINIPGTNSATAVQKGNEYFANYEVGDFVKLNAITEYDTINNYGMGFVLENFWSQIGLLEPEEEEIPEIFAKWSLLKADVDEWEYYDEESLLPMAFADTADGVISITYSDEYFDIPVDDLFTDASFIPEDLHANGGTLDITVNVKVAKSDTLFEGVKTTLLGLGYEETGESQFDKGELIVAKKNTSSKTVSMMIVDNYGDYFEVMFIGNRMCVEQTFTTFAEAKAKAEELVNGRILALSGVAGRYATALFDLNEGGVTGVSYTVDWRFLKSLESYYSAMGLFAQYSIVVELNHPEYTSQAVALYVQKLAQAGFVEKQESAFAEDGWWNATTKEFVQVTVVEGEEGEPDLLELYVCVHDTKSAQNIKDPFHSDKDLLDAFDAELNAWHSAAVRSGLGDYLPAAADVKFLTSFSVGGVDAIGWSFAEYTDYSNYLVIWYELEFTYPSAANVTEIAASLKSSFLDLGYIDNVPTIFYNEEPGDWLGMLDDTNGIWVCVEADTETNTVLVTVQTLAYQLEE